ncbi:metallophosphoesterase [Verrucomicrobiota bacterium sgz303538]
MIRRSFSLLLLSALPLCAQTVLVAPYVQPGNGTTLNGTDVKVLTWLTDQKPGEFTVEYGSVTSLSQKAVPERLQLDFGLPTVPKKAPATPAPTKVTTPLADAPTNLEDFKEKSAKETAVPTPEKEQHYFRYTATLENLPFDSTVHYRVKQGAKVVREGEFKTRASAGKPIRFVAVGDLASGKREQNSIAWQIAQQRPDFMVALGDIVYSDGRVSQYMHHFWSTYNDVAKPGPQTGVPLMASVPIYPVVGNHDVNRVHLSTHPDAFGVYYFFHAPLNGPGVGSWNTPLTKTKPEAAAAFREKVGANYPALNVYSWDNGPAHFLALDSNTYVKIEDPNLRAWVENDLRSSKQPWKFVCFHSPAFQTSREHYTEQKLRLWEPMFEKYGVDVVFAGHVHNYQRSKPLRFTPTAPRDARGRVNGDITLDDTFDGVTDTTPEGVIHIVSGGGGAGLYSVDLNKTIEALKKEHGANYVPLTAKYFAAKHCFSVVELTATTFTLRQIDITGQEIDKFTITKAAK